jgi:hypothetical protein
VTDHSDLSDPRDPLGSGGSDKYDEGSRVEALEAAIHHHHPADPNVGIVRAKPGPHALLAGAIAAAVTITAVVLLALAIGGN